MRRELPREKVGEISLRYEKKVYFIKEESVYNQDNGRYITKEIPIAERWADVTDTGTEAMNLLYGKILQGAKTIRIKTKVLDEFNYIVLDKQRYLVETIKTFRQEQVMYVVGS